MYLFRVVPGEDSSWLCKRGSRVVARFETIVDAVDRAEVEAVLHRPSQVLFQDSSGSVSVLSSFPVG